MDLWREVAQEVKTLHPHIYNSIKSAGFGFRVVNERGKFFGKCWFENKIVEVNLYLHKRSTKDMIVDTMLHEIAHAMDYCIRGKSNHDGHWRKIAKELGANPRATSKVPLQVDYLYVTVIKYADGRIKRGAGYNKKPAGCKPGQIMKGYFAMKDKEDTLNRLTLYTWADWCKLAKQYNLDIYDKDKS